MASTSYNATTLYACPSERDVNGGSSGFGRIFQESTFGKLLKGACSLGNFVVSGFTLPTSGSGVGRTLTGEAVIDGRVLGPISAVSVNFPYAKTWVFLRLTYLDGKANGVVIECHDAWDNVANSILLGTVNTSGGSVTGATEGRSAGRVIWGNVHLNASAPYCTPNCNGSNDWTPSKSGSNLVITFREAIWVAAAVMLYPSQAADFTLATGSLTIVDSFINTTDQRFALLA